MHFELECTSNSIDLLSEKQEVKGDVTCRTDADKPRQSSRLRIGQSPLNIFCGTK